MKVDQNGYRRAQIPHGRLCSRENYRDLALAFVTAALPKKIKVAMSHSTWKMDRL